MKSKTNMLLIRRILFALIIAAAATLQSTKGLVPKINEVSAFILIPLVVCIALFEKSVPSLLFGAFAGIMWDMYSVTADGFFSVVLTATGFLTAIVILFFMRNNIMTALILSIVSTFFCNTLYWFNFVLMADSTSSFYIYLRYYLPSVLYTSVFTFVFYYTIRFIYEKTSPERKRINY